MTDITYIRTWQGWLYLAVVVDLFARKVVGWSMKPTLHRDIVMDALLMAVWRRRPKQTLLVHSGQGSQYSSDNWLRFCKSHSLEPSMSRRGNCWDNAVIATSAALALTHLNRRLFEAGFCQQNPRQSNYYKHGWSYITARVNAVVLYFPHTI